MNKKKLIPESMPEFDEGIKNMSDYSKGLVDGKLKAQGMMVKMTKGLIVSVLKNNVTTYFDEEGNAVNCVDDSSFEYVANEIINQKDSDCPNCGDDTWLQTDESKQCGTCAFEITD